MNELDRIKKISLTGVGPISSREAVLLNLIRREVLGLNLIVWSFQWISLRKYGLVTLIKISMDGSLFPLDAYFLVLISRKTNRSHHKANNT